MSGKEARSRRRAVGWRPESMTRMSSVSAGCDSYYDMTGCFTSAHLWALEQDLTVGPARIMAVCSYLFLKFFIYYSGGGARSCVCHSVRTLWNWISSSIPTWDPGTELTIVRFEQQAPLFMESSHWPVLFRLLRSVQSLRCSNRFIEKL